MDMKEDITQAQFTEDNAKQLQPIMENFMAGCDGGEENWLANKLAQSLPEESEDNRKQIINEIEAGVSKFDTSLASLQEAIDAGDTKEEWLEENLRQSLNELSEKEYGTTLFAANKALHTVNENTMATIDGTPVPASLEESPTEEYDWSEEENRALTKHLGQEIQIGALAGQVVNAGFAIAEKTPLGGKIAELKNVAEALRSGDDGEIKKAASAALVVGVQKGIVPLPKTTPVGTITALASGGIESAKVMLQYADGEISGQEVLERTEQIVTVQVSQGLGLAGEKLGRSIGAKIGLAVGSFVPFLAPVAVTVGGFVGGMVGKLAGSKIGQAIGKAARKVAEVAKPVVKKVWNTVKNVGRTIMSGVKSFVSWLFG